MQDGKALEALIAELRQQEDELQFTRFGNDEAIDLGMRFVATARANRLAIAIDVQRNGQQLFHAALPGTSADNDSWIVRKRNVVDRFGHSSYLVGSRWRAKGTTFEASSGLDPQRYAAHGGSFPLLVRGVGPVGTITVSGLPQVEDHELVVRVLREALA